MGWLTWVITGLVILIVYVAVGALLTLTLYGSRRGRKILLGGAVPDHADIAAGVFLWPLMLIIGATLWVLILVERRVHPDDEDERQHSKWTS